MIDADALKDKLLTYFSLEDGGTAMQIAALCAIDSAPTVKLTDEAAIECLQASGWMQKHDCEMSRPHWISVKDRLPEKHVDVLINVLCDSGDFVCTAWLEDRGWNDDAGGWPNDDVTHWMPLPSTEGLDAS